MTTNKNETTTIENIEDLVSKNNRLLMEMSFELQTIPSISAQIDHVVQKMDDMELEGLNPMDPDSDFSDLHTRMDIINELLFRVNNVMQGKFSELENLSKKLSARIQDMAPKL